MEDNVIYNKFSRQAALYYFEKRNRLQHDANKYSSRYSSREPLANLRRENSTKEIESKSNDTFACGLIFVEDT